MLPSDMNLNNWSETGGCNNEILVFDSGTSEPKKSSHKVPIVPKHAPMPKAVLPSPKHTSVITHEEERVALVLVLTSAFGIWYAFVNEGYETR